MSDFRNHACWEREDAESVLATLATEDADAVFLARHTPIRGFRIEAANEISLDEPDEESLLRTLVRQRRHALVVVEGEPGSGKSHLIRWLNIRWRGQADSGDEVVLIPKSKSTLGRTLQFLRERMPARYRDVFDDVQTSESFLTGEGRVHELVNKLALALDPDCVAERVRLDHAAWAARTGAAELLQVPRLGKTWAAPRRIVDAYSDPEAPAEKRQFSLADVRELVVTVKGRGRSFGHHAKALFGQLEREQVSVLEYLREGRGLAQLRADQRDEIEASANLLEALNSRLRYAIQLSIGVRPDQLRKAFEELRVRLAGDRKRLVLLLEDITDFQGLDNQLIEALIQRAGDAGEGDLCPLVAVLGITPGFYNDYLVQMNYLRDRIALHVSLSEGTGLQDTISLKSESARRAFAARYLNTVRLGVTELESRFRGSTFGVLPSACSACDHRVSCHATFGATSIDGVDDDVGFYPLTGRALDAIYGHLKDPEGTGSLKTPRGLIQNVLGPVLRHPAAVHEGRFPTSHLGSTQLRDRGLGPNVSAVTSKLDAQRDRVERFVTWWGDPRGAAFSRGSGGDVFFGGIGRDLFDVFGMVLPWDGAATVQPLPPPRRGPSEEFSPVDGSQPPPSAPPVDARADQRFERHLEALAVWFRGGDLEGEPEVFWSSVLRELIDSLPWAATGIPEATRRAVFGERGVLLVGTRQTNSVFQLLVGPTGLDEFNNMLHLGMEGWVRLRDGRPLPGETVRHQSDVSRMLDWLSERVRRHVASLPTTIAGVPWEPAETLVRSLVLGLWLSLETDPTAGLLRTWVALLNSDFSLKSGGKCREWGTAFSLVADGSAESPTISLSERKMRLLKLLQLPGEYRGAFYDAGAIAAWLKGLQAGNPGPAGPVQFPRAWKSEGEIARLKEEVETATLAAVAGEEAYRLERAEAINSRLQGRALDDYLDSADRVVEQFRTKIDPRVVSNDRVQKWRQMLERLDKALDEPRREFLGALDPWIDPDSALGRPPTGELPERLNWCYRWPTEWARIPALVEDAHGLLEVFHSAARQILDAEGGGAGRAALTEAAARLSEAIDGLNQAVDAR